jgi:iron complex outermembrane receptor protein
MPFWPLAFVFPLAAALAVEEDVEEVVIEGRSADAAMSVELDRAGVEALPGRSADEMLRAVPGMQLSAHGGRGKAFQYLVRGFDAVHGQDVAGFVEGIPLNEVSNVHGHGYLDLYFVPPVLVRGMKVDLGTAQARVGDFGTAASVDLSLGLVEEGLLVEAGGGTDRSGTALLAWRPPEAEEGTFITADVDAGAGVADGRGWRMLRSAWGAELPMGTGRWRMRILGYDGVFESPGVLRQDDIDAGRVGFYDAYPQHGGGRSSRFLLSTSATWSDPGLGGEVLGYAMARKLSLRQSYTGFAREPERGDASLQQHSAWQLGLRTQVHGAALDGRLRLRGGADVRLDLIDQRDEHIDTAGEVWNTHYDGAVRQTDLGAWLDLRATPVGWLTLEPGLRVEGLWVDLLRRVDEQVGELAEPRHEQAWAPVVAPKGLITLRPHDRLDLLLSYGRGFRSPDARGVADGDRAPVTLSDTVELGLDAAPAHGVELRAAGFATWLSNELVFDHVVGRFLSAGATRRFGGELVLAWRPIDALRLQLEGSGADGRYVASREPIPFAPRWMGSVGAYAEGLKLADSWWTGGLRVRVVGQRPLPSGFVSHMAVVGDLTLHGEWRGWVLDVDLDNLFFNRWRDGEFVFPSYWDRSRPESELSVLHITAGDPSALRIAVGRRFGCGRCR